MIIITFGLCGIKFKKSHEFGVQSEAPFWSFSCLFFQLIKFNKGASSRFIGYAWDMYSDKRNTKEWLDEVQEAKQKNYKEIRESFEKRYRNELDELEKRNESLQRQYSQVYYEKHVLQQTIKILNGEEVKPDFYQGAKRE